MMKRLLILLIAILPGAMLGQVSTTTYKPDVGAVFEIGKAAVPQFMHINFPKPNFIIKRGGLADYAAVENLKVVVASVKERKNGTVLIRVKRADGRRFFGSHVYVAADFNAALESGELRERSF